MNLIERLTSNPTLNKINLIVATTCVVYVCGKLVIIPIGSILRGESITSSLFKSVLQLPGMKNVVTSQIDKEVEKSITQMFPKPEEIGTEIFDNLPTQGLTYDNVLQILKDRQTNMKDIKPEEGRAFAYVYDSGREHVEFLSRVNNLFIHTNALNPLAFSSLRLMENEIVSMALNLFNAPKPTQDDRPAGSLTSGGTESLLLMVKTYRDYALAQNPKITTPTMILPRTAHPAMYKAASYFRVSLEFIDVDPQTQLPSPRDYESKINSQTICLVCSAPQYPHGCMDPVEQVGKIAQKYGVPLHVDSCIGGFILPFMERLGHPVPLWDFRVPGVTSISADIHKYGYSVKGSSVLVYSSYKYRRYQFCVSTDWPGGFYISPTMLGTRGGGPIAAAWASLVALGEESFKKHTKSILETSKYIRDRISLINDIEIIGKPVGHIISFKSISSSLPIHAVADVMEEQKGWKLERQIYPDSLHVTLMPQHARSREQFMKDLKESIEIVKKDPKKYAKEGTCAIYGNVANLPKKEGLVEGFLTAFLDYTYRL